jgi:DEAD/DEAH box helicase domain-containing protein
MSKHLECCCAETGIASDKIEKYFGPTGVTIADILVKEGKLSKNRDGFYYAKGYPHMQVNIRGNQRDQIQLVDKERGDIIIEEMSSDVAFREVYPNAIYYLQNDTGEMSYYKSEGIDLVHKRATLLRLPQNPNLITTAKLSYQVKSINILADPVLIPTSVKDCHIEMGFFWGEISINVTGYCLFTRKFGRVCKNSTCGNYNSDVNDLVCPNCSESTLNGEQKKMIGQFDFEQPYKTVHQAPVISIKMNDSLHQLITSQIDDVKERLKAAYGKNIPKAYSAFFDFPASMLALHSFEHLINFAVPMLVLSSRDDLNALCYTEQESEESICYLFDTSEGGNGAAEALYERFLEFVEQAKVLMNSCDCEFGCPRCLFRKGCLHENGALDKQLGGLLLNSIASQVE